MLCLGGGANLLLGHRMHRRPLDPIVIRGRPVTKVNIVSFSISFGSPGPSGQWSLLVPVASGPWSQWPVVSGGHSGLWFSWFWRQARAFTFPLLNHPRSCTINNIRQYTSLNYHPPECSHFPQYTINNSDLSASCPELNYYNFNPSLRSFNAHCPLDLYILHNIR